MTLTPVPFRFESEGHRYFVEDRQRPSVTQLLERAGLSDPRWFTEASRERGTAVHELTASYDLGVQKVVPACFEHPHKGYLLAYQAASKSLRPIWQAIEETEMHPEWLFGTRIDRLGDVFGQFTNCELKSGVKTEAHPYQMALQNICVAWRYHRTPQSIQRLAIYLKPNGKFRVESFTDNRDYDVAHDVLRRFCV